jgi:fatty-acyl-CoA synthase
VRVVEAIPVTATNKVDKKPLRAARWWTGDPVWHRPAPGATYQPMTSDDVSALEEAFAANGRSNLLGK